MLSLLRMTQKFIKEQVVADPKHLQFELFIETLMAEGSRCVSECTPGLYYASGQFCIPCGENCSKSKSLEHWFLH